MYRYEQIISEIRPASQIARREAASYIDSLVKPPGSLGKLERLAIDIAGIAASADLSQRLFKRKTLHEGYDGITGDVLCSQLNQNTEESVSGIDSVPESTLRCTPDQNPEKSLSGIDSIPESTLRVHPDQNPEESVSETDGIDWTALSRRMKKRAVIVMCADNGVYSENVSSAPQETTLLLARAMAEEKSGMTVLAREAGSDCVLVDVGINCTGTPTGLLHRKISKGTANIAKGPAMTRQMCARAIETGIEIVEMLKAKGFCLVGTGELGMANTTTAACVLMALTGLDADRAVGKGAGLTDKAYDNKKSVVRRALSVNKPKPNDPIDTLSKVGGFDIAGLTGVYLGAAYCRMPVVIDGFISAVAAMAAFRLCPASADFMIPSHASAEPGFAFAMQEIGKEPMLYMDMRLGEGSGCPLAFHLIDSALAMAEGMATFAEASVNGGALVDLR